MKQIKWLPPYARRIIQILSSPSDYTRYAGTSADGTKLTFWVLIGKDAWDKAKSLKYSQNLFIIIPPEKNPGSFTFDFLVGHDPILLLQCGCVDKQTIKTAVISLMRDGVCRILFLGKKKNIRFLREDVKDAT